MNRRGRNGLALIIVVGVLAVLAVVATAFVMMAELERKASVQRLLSTKAYLLARSGIEDALARVSAGQNPDAVGSEYRGEDWDADNAVTGLEAVAEVYQPGVPNLSDCPLRQAMRPSFYARHPSDLDSKGNRAPRRVRVDGRERGYAGRLAGDNATEGNTYALKVSVPDGFYVNGGRPLSAAGTGYNLVLRRVLGTLAEAIDRETGGDDGIPVDQVDGEALINSRPLTSAGWLSLDQIRTGALGGSQAKLEALRPYLTLRAWEDKHVIAPNGPSLASVGTNLTTQAQANNYYGAKSFEVIAGANVGRAPVYLGWARTRKPALIALMAGLQGVYIDEGSTNNWGKFQLAEITNTWSAADQCHVATDALLGFAGPLDTWSDWHAFCDTIPFTAVSTTPQATSNLREAMRDILKANFNPNTDMNKCNPNPSLWKRMDKQDLLLNSHSTEFSLFPIQGREFQSVGRVLSRNGRLLALRALRATLAGPKVVRLTTQKEFVCGNLGSLDLPADETLPRLPGDQPYISLSRGTGYTWGSTRANLQVASGRGIALQSYPEPCVAVAGSGTALSCSGNGNDYDGNLQLATLETLAGYTYLASGGSSKMMMLARFDDGFDLDLAGGATICSVDSNMVTTAQLGNTVWSGGKSSTLRPDGAYSEYQRMPAYTAAGNVVPYHGLLSFWFKNSKYISTAAYYYSGNTYVSMDHYNVLDSMFDSDTQIFWLGYYTCADRAGFLAQKTGFAHFFEIQHGSDKGGEFMFMTPDRIGPPRYDEAHRWKLLTGYWDYDAAKDEVGELVVDAGLAAIDQGSFYEYCGSGSGKGGEDYTLPDVEGAIKILLGMRGRAAHWEPSGPGQGPDATLDEFAIYDFGAGGGGAGGPASTLASNRYKDGRYYKDALYFAPGATGSGQAGSWISAPIALPAGSLLKSVHWTWYRPTAPPTPLPDDYAEIELLDNAGAGYLWPSGSRSGKKASQSWALNRILPAGSFRARVTFTRDGAVPIDPDGTLSANTPILDSPVFDDLSFVYLPPGGDGFLSWAEGE